MISYPDNRNGTGVSKSVEVQTDNLKPGGRDNLGFDKFEYFDNVPFLVKKTTYSVIGDESFWSDLIIQLESDYQSITTILTGVYKENVNVGSGFFIIDGSEFFAGSYTEVDYGTNTPVAPPAEFKIVESYSANVSPQGYLPGTNQAIYSTKTIAPSLTRNSTLRLSSAQTIQLLSAHPTDSNFILTGLSFSNPRIIGGVMYVDSNLSYTNKLANITI